MSKSVSAFPDWTFNLIYSEAMYFTKQQYFVIIIIYFNMISCVSKEIENNLHTHIQSILA